MEGPSSKPPLVSRFTPSLAWLDSSTPEAINKAAVNNISWILIIPAAFHVFAQNSLM